MSVDRPTFHESWHRVAGLAPRLRASMRVVRQTHRGQVWHVIEDASGSAYFRVSEPGWRFIGLLDGRTTVARAWDAACRAMGDDAPTQGEVIQLLGQLYGANLLRADIAGDTEPLLRRRTRRVGRELRATLTNLLFLRVPLWDPDAFLTRWMPLVAWLVSPLGLILWLALLATGAWHLIGRESDLASGLSGVLAADNLLWLYLTFAVIKGLHELGHGFVCKALGHRVADPSGASGAVHTIGIMFMVFMPVPYVDASSSWLFRGKWDRIAVASAGIVVELGIAAVAAVIWARSAPGTLASALSFNAMFLAGVSTLIFNGNPLMRYDGYYILADLLELPNLAKRSQDYAHYLVKKYAWGVRRALSPAYATGERLWLAWYYVASGLYRIVVFVAITLFILDQQWVLGAVVLALVGLMWLLIPMGKLVRYLAADPELSRTRGRALWSSVVTSSLILLVAGLVPLPDHVRIEGIVEPAEFRTIYAGTEGRIESVLASGLPVDLGGESLVRASNPEIVARRRIIDAELRRLETSRSQALASDPARLLQVQEELAALKDQSAWVDENLAALEIGVPMEGTWIAPRLSERVGGSMRRGEPLGVVADLSELVVRATADQQDAASIIDEARPAVEVRARRRPQQSATGTVERVLPAGADRLPSAALGFGAGGTVATDPRDRDGARALQQFFEVRLRLHEAAGLLPGQRVVARVRLSDRPLLAQAWRAVAQVLQERFRV